MQNIKITINFDIAKEGRKVSRELFQGAPRGSRRHKDVKKYTRKEKHKKDYRSS